MKCYNMCAPLVTRKVRRPPAPWINANLLDLMQKRNNMQKYLKKDRHNVRLQEKYDSEKKSKNVVT